MSWLDEIAGELEDATGIDSAITEATAGVVTGGAAIVVNELVNAIEGGDSGGDDSTTDELSDAEAAAEEANAIAEEALGRLRDIQHIGGYSDLEVAKIEAQYIEGSEIAVDNITASTVDWRAIADQTAASNASNFALRTSQATSAAITDATRLNAQMSSAFYDALEKAMPGILGVAAKYQGTVEQMLSGQLSQDVIDLINTTSTEQGYAGGQYGQLARNRTLRDLGLTSLDYITKGQNQMTNLVTVARNLMPEQVNTSDLAVSYLGELLGYTMLTPEQAINAEEFNVTELNDIAVQNQNTQYSVAAYNANQRLAVQEYNSQTRQAIDMFNAANKWTADVYNQQRDISIDQYNTELDYSIAVSMLGYASDQQTNAWNYSSQQAYNDAMLEATDTAGMYQVASAGLSVAGSTLAALLG